MSQALYPPLNGYTNAAATFSGGSPIPAHVWPSKSRFSGSTGYGLANEEEDTMSNQPLIKSLEPKPTFTTKGLSITNLYPQVVESSRTTVIRAENHTAYFTGPYTLISLEIPDPDYQEAVPIPQFKNPEFVTQQLAYRPSLVKELGTIVSYDDGLTKLRRALYNVELSAAKAYPDQVRTNNLVALAAMAQKLAEDLRLNS